MAFLDTLRNASIGIAVMLLIPSIVYVGTNITMQNPVWPSYPGEDATSEQKSEYKIKVEEYNKAKEQLDTYFFYISSVVGLLSIIVGAAAVIMIIVSGLRYITSGGDSGKVAGAKNALIYALVGVAVAALAQLMVHFVLSKAGTAK